MIQIPYAFDKIICDKYIHFYRYFSVYLITPDTLTETLKNLLEGIGDNPNIPNEAGI